MNHSSLQERTAELKRRASGRWTSILLHLGVPAQLLNHRNQPCPHCGGRDRFQYTDRFGDGNYFCRGCGPGDGFSLLMSVHGWSFGTAVKESQPVWAA